MRVATSSRREHGSGGSRTKRRTRRNTEPPTFISTPGHGESRHYRSVRFTEDLAGATNHHKSHRGPVDSGDARGVRLTQLHNRSLEPVKRQSAFRTMLAAVIIGGGDRK